MTQLHKETAPIFILFCKTARSVYKHCHVRRCVCPHGTSRLPLDGFSRNLIFEYFFFKSVKIVENSLQSDKNNGYFTLRPIYIFDNISLYSSQN